eukprot:jgi/Mesen1/6952/ME000360S06213
MDPSLNQFSALSLDDEGEAEAYVAQVQRRFTKTVSTNSSPTSSRKMKHVSATVDRTAGHEAQSSLEGARQEQTIVATGENKKTWLRGTLVWIDLEMTGLDVKKDRILEIACIVTDGNLDTIIEGPDLVIHQNEEVLRKMNDWCQKHHAESGLVQKVRESTWSEFEAEKEIITFLELHTTSGRALLAGNSVYVDLSFLKAYMPMLALRFSHVLVDVSSVRALANRWYPADAMRAPKKKETHRALDDIRESIEELKFLRKAVFKKPQP